MNDPISFDPNESITHWINTHLNTTNFDQEQQILSLLSELQIKYSDLDSKQSSLSSQLITTLPSLTPSLQILQKHIQTSQQTFSSIQPSSSTKESDLTSLPVFTHLQTLLKVSDNLNKTKHQLLKSQKWQNIHSDVLFALEKNLYKDAALLLIDALNHSNHTQKQNIESLCDRFVVQSKLSLLNAVKEMDSTQLHLFFQVYKKMDKLTLYFHCCETRVSIYCDEFEKGGFKGMLECVLEDRYMESDHLLVKALQSLEPTINNHIRSDFKSFYLEFDQFIRNVGGKGEWAESLLKELIEVGKIELGVWNDLTSLMKQSDILLNWCERFMYGLTLTQLPLALIPAFRQCLDITLKTKEKGEAQAQVEGQVDTWDSVDKLCTMVESYILFQDWYEPFQSKYTILVNKPFQPSLPYTFLIQPQIQSMDFECTKLFRNAIKSMEDILTQPLYSFQHNPITNNAVLAIPKFSDSPSDKIVFLSEYVLTLPQYLDMFKDRKGFIKLGKDGVLKWTYYVANRVKDVCIEKVDQDYFANLCRVIGME